MIKTFAIALENNQHSQDMLKDCLTSAKQYDWDVTVWKAVDGQTVTKDLLDNLNLRLRLDKVGSERLGQQGCFLSHWYLWHKCVELDEDIVIVEHDAIFKGPWINLKNSDQIIKLHREIKAKPHWKTNDEDVGKWTPSTHAYFLPVSQAKILIKNSFSLGLMPADYFMGDKVVNYTHLDFTLVDRNPRRESTTSK